MADITGEFRKPFAEQIAAFRLRLGDLVPTAKWDDISHAQHDMGFMVAGAWKLDLLADIGSAMDKAESQGTGLQEFRRDFRRIVETRGWHGWTGEGTKKGEAWRTRVIYRTNMATSYASGRMAQLVAGDFKFWVYRHGSSREPRLQHLGWDGLILPPDHPFWLQHAPPNGWGCSCFVAGADSVAEAVGLGGKPGLALPDNWNSIDPTTGAQVGIGKGWGYSPGASVSRTINAVAEKLSALPSPTGAQLINEWPDRLFETWADSFSDFVAGVLTGPPRGQMMIVGGLKPNWVTAAQKAGVMPATSEIAVRDQDIWHAFRGAKTSPLDMDWYRRLPVHLRNPTATLLDNTQKEGPSLLLIFDMGGDMGKIVVRLNYSVKKQGMLNIVRTGTKITDADLGAMFGTGVTLIDGKL